MIRNIMKKGSYLSHDELMDMKMNLSSEYYDYVLEYESNTNGSFNLSHMNLTELPDEILELPYIKELNISYNRLPFLTTLISDLKRLKKIDMRVNELIGIPEYLWNLPELEEVIMDGHLFPCIPNDIKADNTVVKPIKELLIAHKHRHPYSDKTIKELFGYAHVLLKKKTITFKIP